MYNQQLLTNLEHIRRGLEQSSSCSLCGHGNEDILHNLRDCTIAKDVLKIIILSDQQNKFFYEPFHSWFLTYSILLCVYRIVECIRRAFLGCSYGESRKIGTFLSSKASDGQLTILLKPLRAGLVSIRLASKPSTLFP